MSGRTRKIKNPFNSQFAKNTNILSANNPNNLAVAVIERAFPNMPDMNTPLNAPTISGIEAFNMTNKIIEPGPRYVTLEYAMFINAKYASYDVVGTNNGHAAERLDAFMAKNYMDVEDPNPLPPVDEVYRLSKGDLFGDELVALVAHNIQRPVENPNPRFNLGNSLSETIIKAAARLRIEAFANKAMVNDLHINPRITTKERFDAVKKLMRVNDQKAAVAASNRAAQELIELEKEEAKPKPKKGKAKPLTMAQQFQAKAIAYEQQRAARPAPLIVPDRFLDPSSTTLNEAVYMNFMRSQPRMNMKNQEQVMKMQVEFYDKLERQLLLHLRRMLLERMQQLKEDLEAHRMHASKGGSAAKQSFQNRINALRQIKHLISFRAGYMISRHNCAPMFSPLINCIEGRHTEAEHRRQLETIRGSLHAQAEQIVAERSKRNMAGLAIMAKHSGRAVQNMELRKIRNPDGSVLRQYLPKNMARSALTINEPDPTVENIYRELLTKRGLPLE